VSTQVSSKQLQEPASSEAVEFGRAEIENVTSPAPRDRWKRAIDSDLKVVPYQSPEWTDSACDTGQFKDVSRAYRFSDGSEYVIPLLQKSAVPSVISFVGSMPPAWGMGGIIGSKPLNAEVLSRIVTDLRNTSYMGIHLRPNPLNAKIWADVGLSHPTERRAHVLDLSGGLEKLWSEGFNSRLRTTIRKAERTLEVEFDTTGRLMSTFYELLLKSVDRWARKQNEPLLLARWRAKRRDPLAKFHSIATKMGEKCVVGVASNNGKPLAAVIVLVGKNANYSRGAMDVELVGSTGANELLQAKAIQFAIEAGCSSYHMGESGNSKNLSRFKEKFGAKPVDYADYQLERLPISRIMHTSKTLIKRTIGFKDGQ